MEEATGAPSSLAAWTPKRLRASGRDGGLSHDDATPVSSHNAPFPTYKAAHLHHVIDSSAAWPIAARAQQPDQIRRIGVLIALSEKCSPEESARISALN